MNDKQPEVLGYATLLQELQGTDASTGLLTRSNLYTKLIKDLARCERYGNKLAVVSIRIIGGEGPSDTVAMELANEIGNRLSLNVRNVDEAARWSEREFLIVLPETDFDGTLVFIHKTKALVDALLEQGSFSGFEVQTQHTCWESGDDMPGILSRVGL